MVIIAYANLWRRRRKKWCHICCCCVSFSVASQHKQTKPNHAKTNDRWNQSFQAIASSTSFNYSFKSSKLAAPHIYRWNKNCLLLAPSIKFEKEKKNRFCEYIIMLRVCLCVDEHIYKYVCILDLEFFFAFENTERGRFYHMHLKCRWSSTTTTATAAAAVIITPT